MADKPKHGRKPFKGGRPSAARSNSRTKSASGGNRIAMTFSCPFPKAMEIDARWISLKLKGRSEYLAALVAADLAAAREGRTLIDL